MTFSGFLVHGIYLVIMSWSQLIPTHACTELPLSVLGLDICGPDFMYRSRTLVQVATSTAFDAPVKLYFPNLRYIYLELGDVAASGPLIALTLRCDLSRVKFDFLVVPGPKSPM